MISFNTAYEGDKRVTHVGDEGVSDAISVLPIARFKFNSEPENSEEKCIKVKNPNAGKKPVKRIATLKAKPRKVNPVQ